MKKNLLLVLLFLILGCLTACGKSSKNESGGNPVASTQAIVIKETTQNVTVKETSLEENTTKESSLPSISEPIVYTGKGDSVISIEHLDDLSVFYITGNADSKHFSVRGYDANDNPTNLFVNTVKPYAGLLLDSAEPTTSFEIKASGDWSIEVRSILDCKVIPIGELTSGIGDDILIIRTQASTAHIVGNTASTNFSVRSYGGRSNLLVNTIDEYEGTVKLKDDPVLLEIHAVGEWSILLK